MKSKAKHFFTRLFGIRMTEHQMQLASLPESANTGVRLARVPFFIFHVVLYACIFFAFQVLQSISVAKTGYEFELGKITEVTFIFLLSVFVMPVYVRRAHDIGWSMKHVFYWSVLPSFLRALCIFVPFIALLNMKWMTGLFAIMPWVGLLFWILTQVQLAFMVLLFFAPGSGLHNRYGTVVARAFTLENLYGYRLIKGRKDTDGDEHRLKIDKIVDETTSEPTIKSE